MIRAVAEIDALENCSSLVIDVGEVYSLFGVMITSQTGLAGNHNTVVHAGILSVCVVDLVYNIDIFSVYNF